MGMCRVPEQGKTFKTKEAITEYLGEHQHRIPDMAHWSTRPAPSLLPMKSSSHTKKRSMERRLAAATSLRM